MRRHLNSNCQSVSRLLRSGHSDDAIDCINPFSGTSLDCAPIAQSGLKGESMATLTSGRPASDPHLSRIRSSAEFTQTLMKLQRATHLIASTLDLDELVDRVVNEIAGSIGNVEVSVWLRSENTEEMVLCGVRGCSRFCKGSRLKIGEEGMVGHAAGS